MAGGQEGGVSGSLLLGNRVDGDGWGAGGRCALFGALKRLGNKHNFQCFSNIFIQLVSLIRGRGKEAMVRGGGKGGEEWMVWRGDGSVEGKRGGEGVGGGEERREERTEIGMYNVRCEITFSFEGIRKI